MKTGRRPQPAEVKEAKGNPGKRKMRATQAAAGESAFGAVRPIPKLRHAGVTIWNQIAPDLVGMNLLRPTDRHAFGRYCETLAHYWEVTQKLHKDGDTYTSESVHGTLKRINPYFLLQDRLSKRLDGLEDRFGLTPAARQQIMARFAQQQPSLPLGGTARDEARPNAAEPAAPLPEDPLAFFSPPALH